MGAKYKPAHAGTRGIFVAALFLALALVCGATEAGTILIDDFTQPTTAQIIQNPWPGGTNVTQTIDQTVNVIGGRRETTYTAVGTDFGLNSISGSIGMVNGFNKLQVGSVSGLVAPRVNLFYRGFESDLNANLVDGTNDKIQIQFYSSDAVGSTGLDILVEIFSPGGTSKTLTKDAPNSQSPFVVDFPFSQFAGAGNFADVETIRVTFNGGKLTQNVDFEVRSIAAVPEPAGLLSMAIGGALFGAAFIARRKLKRLPSVQS